ncbi:hypothetical protein F5Y00DRAFT_250253 [Daldinia vernicosa]|uniref:uncharacterized protein n=1 Tax=Daldinia vernicosa TaxID=114800 RepID=UPI002007FA82|nr:uncharacterized protein F5Y00DRAFT_250253 [Daldinia vernicosa]KAI0854080.1 hypothetical protein F5Y00DRAFT_250253 [Daldinia vernicosa]
MTVRQAHQRESGTASGAMPSGGLVPLAVVDRSRLDSMSMRGGHFIKGSLGAFDAPFFSIGAAEAEAMDPSQRFMLETVYRAIENAGIPIERIAGTKTCVYTGCFNNDYAMLLPKDPLAPPKYDTGLACGCNVIFNPEFMATMDNLGFLSKDSRCFSFDHRANGYGRGEGFGVLVIKPLQRALDDGDTIRAVIRSSSSNQDGKTPSLTQPSKEAQESLIRFTYKKAGLDMGSTRYFEAHGTGTPVGDPLETGAIGSVFRHYRSPEEPLYVGSVKSNIGHLEGASGVAGVIKVILALERGIIPPNANFERLNPKIDAEFLNIKHGLKGNHNTVPEPIQRHLHACQIGFGHVNGLRVENEASGTADSAQPNGNEHMNEANRVDAVHNDDTVHHVNGSNRGNRNNDMNNSSHLTKAGADAVQQSEDPIETQVLVWSAADESGIGRLKESWAQYFDHLSTSQENNKTYLRDLAYTLAYRRTHFLWRTFTVAKGRDRMQGLTSQLSIPIKAASSPSLAFVFTGQGAQWFAMGRELLELGSTRLEIACVNSPKNLTISGDAAHLDCLQALLDRNRVFARKLKVTVAYHSFQMKEISENYLACLGNLTSQQPDKSSPIMISSVTGSLIDPHNLSRGEYWVKNMVQPVLFTDALSRLCSQSSSSIVKKLDGRHHRMVSVNHLVEIGPHAALQGPVRDILRSINQEKNVAYISILRRKVSAIHSTLEAAGRLHCAGYALDLDRVNRPMAAGNTSAASPKALSTLPEYDFNHTKEYCQDWNPLQAQWRNIISIAELPWIEDHKINGAILYPAAGMIVKALEAAKQLGESEGEVTGFVLKNISFHSALNIPAASRGIEVDTYLKPRSKSDPKDSPLFDFSICTFDGDKWVENCNGCIQVLYATGDADIDTRKEQKAWHESHTQTYRDCIRKCSTSVNVRGLYDLLSRCGYEKASIAQHHVIHPTTFDGIFQTIFAVYTKGGIETMSTAIPTYIDRLWISAIGLSHPNSDSVQVHVQTQWTGLRETSSNITAFNTSGEKVLIEMKGVRTTIIASADASEVSEQNVQDRCYNIQWKPDLDLNSVDSVLDYYEPTATEDNEPVAHYHDLQTLLAMTIKDTHDRLKSKSSIALANNSHMHKYLNWLDQQAKRLELYNSSTDAPSRVPRPENEVLELRLVEILEGQVEVSDVLSRDSIEGLISEMCFKKLGNYIDAYVHKKPAAKFLQLGIGSTTMVDQLMNVLVNHENGSNSPRYGQFDYADVSSYNSDLRSDGSPDRRPYQRMQPKALDIELDTQAQGFEDGTYDVIICSMISYTTSDMTMALKNCHKLLRPGGKLILLENIKPGAVTACFIFGLLESWWSSSEEYRQDSPCMDKRQWNKLLLKTGFSGSEIELDDFKHPICHSYSVIISTRLPETPATTAAKTSLVILHGTDQAQQVQADEIKSDAEAKGISAQLASLDQARNIILSPETVVISLLELHDPVWLNISPELFHILKKLLTCSPRLIWRRQATFGDGIPLRLDIGTPGLLNSLHFIEDNVGRSAELKPYEIEIHVMSAGVSFRDVLIVQGRLNQRTAGTECAGIVTRCGEHCEDLAVGTRVAAVCLDSFKSFARVDCRSAVRIPSSIPFSIAAAIPFNFATSWYSLKEVAKLCPTETVLIHSGAGATGQAAIQVALHLGAVVFTTVSTEKKKQFLVDRYGIPAEHIFSSRETAFCSGIKRLTRGVGADVILNALSGEGLVASWECIAPYGRFIELGKKNITSHSKLAMSSFEKNVTFRAVDVLAMSLERPQVVRKAMEDILPLVESGFLQPAEPLQVYGVSEIENSFRTMQSRDNMGKVVVEFRSDDTVNVVRDVRPSFRFDTDATYIIAGGLGGLGRSVSRWFVERGARHLILLSRSGAKSTEAQELVAELARSGTKVKTPACDIADQKALRLVLDECLRDMPAVRGCIQSSMVLRDGMFEGMTFESWKESTLPKIQGSWNLHSLLPDGMDFFVLFSSISAIIGNRGQSNYAAGNTFKDALAQYRISKGERAASINLGLFLSTGVLSGDKSLLEKFRARSFFNPMTEPQLFALLDYYCNPAESYANSLDCQTIVHDAAADQPNTDVAYWLTRPLFRQVLTNMSNGDAGTASSDVVNFETAFAAASSLTEASAAVTKALVKKLADTLSLPVEELDATQPMHSYGVDSLVAVDLRSWFAKELQVDFAIFHILGSTSIAGVSSLAAARSKYRKAEWTE